LSSTPEFLRLTELPDDVRDPVRRFGEHLHSLLRERWRAWTVFGAAAVGTYDPLLHQLQSVVVVETVDLEALRQLASEGPRFGKIGIAAPLIMTPAYIDQSRDAFPLELIEIHQAHVTVYGDEHFTDLDFSDADIRLQCERQWKTLLITLRQGLLASAGKPRLLDALEQNVADAILRTLRGMLWIKGHRVAMPATQVMIQIEDIIGHKLPGVRSTIDVAGSHGWPEFRALYEDLLTLSDRVNAW